MKKICIYSSSSNAIDKKYFDESGILCEELSQDYDLVYGGGNLGLMGHAASTFKKAGRHVTGIIPEKLHGKGISYDGVDDLVVTKTMSERKQLMIEKADAFVSLPGGFGTLEEALEVLTLKQLGYHSKPVIFFNVSGFFDNLIKQFEISYDEKFAKETYREYYFVSDSYESIAEYLKHYIPVVHVDKWF